LAEASRGDLVEAFDAVSCLTGLMPVARQLG
jgi:hypothetical protein